MNSLLVVDASVALKWVVSERGSDQAGELLRELTAERLSLIAPEHLIGEVGNGLRKRIVQGVLDISAASEALDALIALDLGLFGGKDRWQRCLRAAHDWSVTTYDALYLLMALEFECDLVTADRRLLESAEAHQLPVRALTG